MDSTVVEDKNSLEVLRLWTKVKDLVYSSTKRYRVILDRLLDLNAGCSNDS